MRKHQKYYFLMNGRLSQNHKIEKTHFSHRSNLEKTKIKTLRFDVHVKITILEKETHHLIQSQKIIESFQKRLFQVLGSKEH